MMHNEHHSVFHADSQPSVKCTSTSTHEALDAHEIQPLEETVSFKLTHSAIKNAPSYSCCYTYMYKPILS